MNSKMVFLMGLGLGLCLMLAAFVSTAQLPVSKFAPLLKPANVSELEWRLIEARLSRVESQVEGLPNLCCVRWYFDPTSNKIKGRLESAPDVWKSLNLELLEEAALFSISDAKQQLEQGPSVVKTDDNDYEIEFVALEKATGQFKIFATYARGKLELSDRKLK